MQQFMPIADSLAPRRLGRYAPALGGLGMMMTIITTITPRGGASG